MAASTAFPVYPLAQGRLRAYDSEGRLYLLVDDPVEHHSLYIYHQGEWKKGYVLDPQDKPITTNYDLCVRSDYVYVLNARGLYMRSAENRYLCYWCPT